MRFAEDDHSGPRIQSYRPGEVVVNGRGYDCGLIVSRRRILADWGPDNVAELSAVHIEHIIETGPEVVLIGTGECQIFPSPASYIELLRQGIGVEIMDTGAACRTYNILMAEGRIVTAGLLV